MHARTHIVRAVSGGLLALGLLLGAESLRWPGALFPGFLVMPNRVVPSVGLAGWSGVDEGRPLYQQVVLAVDDRPVTTADDVYAALEGRAPGNMVRYRVVRRGEVETRTLPAQTLDARAYALVFGSYLVSWLTYLLLAFVAGRRWAEHPVFPALTAFAWAVGTFALTGVDLYGPGRAFRLHVLAEAMLPVSALHLALVFPRNRLAGRGGVLPVLYGGGAALAVAYEMFLYEPAAYTAIHDSCQALVGAALVAFTIGVGLDLERPHAVLDAPALRSVLAGAVVGFGVPAVVLGLSGLTGGIVPVNAIGWFSFAFPVACLVALRAPAARVARPMPVPA